VLAFERPWALILLGLVPAVVWLRGALRARGAAFPVSRSAGASPLAAPPPCRIARAASGASLCLGLAFVALAAAGPTLVTKDRVYLGRGSETIIVLDLSPSMAAADLPPTRLDAAKAIIGDFLATRRNETVGLVAFGNDAALVCPPTTDYEALASRLGSLQPGLYGDGTAIGAGIGTALAHAFRSTAPERHIVLLTDGENNAGSMDPEEAAGAARRRGVSLSVIGVGSPGEAPVSYVDPATHRRRTGIYRSSFDAAALEGFARGAGGGYYAAENEEALERAFADLAERSVSLTRSRSQSRSRGLGPEALGIGLVLAALARLLGLVGGGGRP
jgi:Ca-activated chloride channel family protein